MVSVTACNFKRDAELREFQDVECSKNDINFLNIAPKLFFRDRVSMHFFIDWIEMAVFNSYWFSLIIGIIRGCWNLLKGCLPSYCVAPQEQSHQIVYNVTDPGKLLIVNIGYQNGQTWSQIIMVTALLHLQALNIILFYPCASQCRQVSLPHYSSHTLM